MTAVENPLPLIDVKGDPKMRGAMVGSLYRQRIRAAWRYYGQTVFATSKLSATEIRVMAGQVRERISDFHADYGTEIDALADAAGIARWEAYALNARSEILNARVGECTALYLPASRVLGQTWDWLAALADLATLTRYTYPSGLRILTFAEPGQLAKIGLNSAGLGVCLNFMVALHGPEGVPIHVLGRALLECSSLAEARSTLARAGLGKSSHYLIADANGEAISIEFAGSIVAEAEAIGGIYAHTNHCIASSRDPEGFVVPTSRERLAAACRLADEVGAATATGGVSALRRILDFEDGSPASIRVHYRPEPLLGGEPVGSCATIIMDLPAGMLHARKGPESDQPFTAYRV